MIITILLFGTLTGFAASLTPTISLILTQIKINKIKNRKPSHAYTPWLSGHSQIWNIPELISPI